MCFSTYLVDLSKASPADAAAAQALANETISQMAAERANTVNKIQSQFKSLAEESQRNPATPEPSISPKSNSKNSKIPNPKNYENSRQKAIEVRQDTLPDEIVFPAGK